MPWVDGMGEIRKPAHRLVPGKCGVRRKLEESEALCFCTHSLYCCLPKPRNREDQHLIQILYPVTGTFSMKNTVNRPTSWLPLVIPALQTGTQRITKFWGWLDCKNKFQTSFGCTTRPPSKKKKRGMGEEKGERREERGRDQKALRRKGW